jgi:hypothetical protein
MTEDSNEKPTGCARLAFGYAVRVERFDFGLLS